MLICIFKKAKKAKRAIFKKHQDKILQQSLCFFVLQLFLQIAFCLLPIVFFSLSLSSTSPSSIQTTFHCDEMHLLSSSPPSSAFLSVPSPLSLSLDPVLLLSPSLLLLFVLSPFPLSSPLPLLLPPLPLPCWCCYPSLSQHCSLTRRFSWLFPCNSLAASIPLFPTSLGHVFHWE